MSILYITEYSDVFSDKNARAINIAAQPPVAEQAVTYTTTTQSNAFNARTTYVRLHTDGICSVSFGTNPTATTTNARLAASQTEYFSVPQGASYKVAAVTNT